MNFIVPRRYGKRVDREKKSSGSWGDTIDKKNENSSTDIERGRDNNERRVKRIFFSFLFFLTDSSLFPRNFRNVRNLIIGVSEIVNLKSKIRI